MERDLPPPPKKKDPIYKNAGFVISIVVLIVIASMVSWFFVLRSDEKKISGEWKVIEYNGEKAEGEEHWYFTFYEDGNGKQDMMIYNDAEDTYTNREFNFKWEIDESDEEIRIKEGDVGDWGEWVDYELSILGDEMEIKGQGDVLLLEKRDFPLSLFYKEVILHWCLFLSIPLSF